MLFDNKFGEFMKKIVFEGVVLVADSDLITINRIRHVLEECNYRVETARDGDQFLEKLSKLEEKKVEIDCFLVDSNIAMQETTGFQFAEWLKKKYLKRTHQEDVPVIIISTPTICDDKLNEIKAKRMGADNFLSKPLKSDLLLVMVNGYVELIKVKRKLLLTEEERSRMEEELFSIKQKMLKIFSTLFDKKLDRIRKIEALENFFPENKEKLIV